VLVTLTGPAGATTAAGIGTGFYSFGALIDGTYTVTVSGADPSLPLGAVPTTILINGGHIILGGNTITGVNFGFFVPVIPPPPTSTPTFTATPTSTFTTAVTATPTISGPSTGGLITPPPATGGLIQFIKNTFCCFNGWIFLPLILLLMLLMFRKKEAVVDAETLQYMIEKNKIERFTVYNIESKEFKKVDISTVLKKAALQPWEQEIIALYGITRNDCEVREIPLIAENEKKVKSLMHEKNISEAQARTIILAEQIDEKVFEKHSKEEENGKESR
jgi:hypothetical protein